VAGVLSVNGVLADWARRKLGIRPERVWYIPNFVTFPPTQSELPQLPGIPGKRIACVANLRPQKDHLNLLEAMEIIVRQVPSAHLLLLGAAGDPDYFQKIQDRIRTVDLDSNVTWLGIREDVPSILKSCDVGVLGSVSEGLPLALLEYGMAGLPAVATAVGQCPEVLDGGRAGILVPPSSPESLAQAVLFLLESPKKRAIFGSRLDEHVREMFDPDAITEQVCCIYETVASSGN
jgi:glycosyltransferase involved in cell wall biosynthesis